ncbi:hypothetical protein ES703_111127 [subsurface metagenome]
MLNADKSFSVPSSPDWQPFENYIDIPITSAISPGTEYGLYVKIMGITGGDIFTEYLANVITIIGIPTKGIIENLAIVGYDTPVEAGATCKVAVKFDYRGPRPEDANLYVALGKIINIAFFGWDIAKWFDEEAHGEVKLVDIEESKELMPYEASVDIPIPSDLSSGEYSLYAKITGRDVSDYLSEPLENVVTIIGPPPASDLALPDPGFEATPGTYDLGDRVPWTMVYQYKGKAQGGYLTISLGTGVAPSFFTKYTFPRVAVSFDEAMDWTSSQLSGRLTLPTTLETGQTYSVRAKLETADGAQETDTDWGVITIAEVAPPEYTLTIVVSPSGAGWVTKNPDKTRYTYGEIVRLTAHSAPGYSFESWWVGDEFLGSGESINFMVLGDHTITAYFLEKVVPEYTLTVWVSPMAAGWVTKEPDKTKYSYGEIVKLTAREAPGYSFQSWWVGDEFLSSGNPINFMVVSDRTITAYYL